MTEGGREREKGRDRGSPGDYMDIGFFLCVCICRCTKASLCQESSSAWSDEDSWPKRVEALVSLLLNPERAGEHNWSPTQGSLELLPTVQLT